MDHSLSIETVTDLAGLEELAPHWQALYRRCPNATPFQSPEWLLAWWRAFAPGVLNTLAIRHNGRLVGLAPLYLDSGRLLPLGIALSDFLDVLVEPAEVDEAGPLVARELASSNAWSSCEWPELRADATVWRLPVPHNAKEETCVTSTCPVLRIAAPTLRLRDLIPAHRMQALRTGWNRARRIGDARVTTSEPSSIERCLHLLDRLHTARWDAVGMPGVTADRRVLDCLRRALPPLIERGEAVIYGLELDGECVAAHLVLNARERALSYMTGFALEVSSISPGALLLGHAIEQALCNGQSEFDFLRGEERYKSLWGALPRRNAARTFRRP